MGLPEVASVGLQSLSFRYPGASEDTLRHIDLTVADGEAFALLGASGAGKTTMLNLLSGLLAPTDGRVVFNDDDVSHAAPKVRNVAQVFQFPVLYDSLSVADNLAFPLRARGVARQTAQARVDAIVGELGLSELLARKPGGLSMFQKQLVAIGRALVRPDVSVVLLDEPLTAVEPKIKWQLRRSLRRVQQELGVTMIYVTHDQTEALSFAQRVAVMADGTLLQVGTPDEIYSQPATEFVGHFIGSPGVNFLPRHVAPRLACEARCERIGFRPEWASLADAQVDADTDRDAGAMQSRVLGTRVVGTRDGVSYGHTQCEVNGQTIVVTGAIQHQRGAQVWVALDRFLQYADGQRIAGEASR